MPPSKRTFWHKMKGNKSTRTPGTLIFLDTETVDEPIPGCPRSVNLAFKMGVAIKVRWEAGIATRRQVLTFWELEGFWDWVYSHFDERRPVFLFAHNAPFDLTTAKFWAELDSKRLHLRSIVRNDPPTVIRVWNDKGSMTVLDTMNWWKCSLAQLGETFGLPKLTMPTSDAPADEWADYCRRDAEIVEAAVIGWMRFVRDNDLGVFRSTAPGQAMQSYRHRFQMDPIVFHGVDEAHKLERDAYYGGICESYYVGRVERKTLSDICGVGAAVNGHAARVVGPATVFDCQSFYPSVMAGNLYPTCLEQVLDHPDVALIDATLKTKCVIAHCLVQTDFPLPCRSKTKGVIHAVGTFWTSLCGPELGYALSRGAVKAIQLAAVYTRGRVFDRYCEAFRHLRDRYSRQGNSTYSALCKLMLNSLYGKFGQKAHEWIDRPDLEPPDDWGMFVARLDGMEKATLCQAIAGFTQVQGEPGETPESHPAIAAYVTSHGRIKLRAMQAVAGAGNVLYSDTDSIHVLPAGRQRLEASGLVRPGEMGFLRFDHEAETAEYRGIKDYTLDDTDTIAGIKRTATRLDGGVFEQPRFERLASILAVKPNGRVRVDMERIAKHGGQSKRADGIGGWTTPFCVRYEAD